MKEASNYYWVRVYDYNHERDQYEKGTMLDEFYLKDLIGGREEAKQTVRDKYCSETSTKLMFAKPKKEADGVYAIVMDSSKFFYDRFYSTINSHCFWCHKAIEGKASEFPRERISGDRCYLDQDNAFSDDGNTAFFCKYECKSHFIYE
ncbi:MAG: Excinuclease subunit domain protein [Bacilli bacterium]|nr:Excinuclease subunit domain protein [Bacilli bacterium]